MPTPYPKNAYIINEDGERRKVLEEHGDLRFVSVKQSTSPKYWETTASAYPFHILELKRDGWDVEDEEKAKDAWPKVKNKYWFIETDGGLYCDFWDNSPIEIRIKTQGLGVYRTQEEALAALRICREALKKAGMVE